MTQEDKCEFKDTIQNLLKKAEKELYQIELTADKSKRGRWRELKKCIKHYSTGGKSIAEYTIVNSYFKREKARGFVYRKYKFYDEPGKYKIGDKLTLQ